MAALAMLVVTATVLQPNRAYAAPPQQEYTYAECSRADEAAVQAEMTTLAHGVLVEGSSGLEIDALVASTWRTLGADATFDAAVDAGIARIEAERGYWERFWSGWSADKAQEFASQVAAYAFEDAALKAKLEELSNEIASSLVVELQSAAARSASSALLCLQSYVGEQYSTTLFAAFQTTVSQELDADLDLSHSSNAQISPLEMHAKGLTGVGVIVATEITRRVALALAEKITERLAGKIVGRVLGRLGSSVVPYLGWAVGIGLLVWDLWEGSQGALPTIREALQAEEVKQEVRAEITAAVSEGVAAEVETMASTLAVTLVGQWQEFCTNHGVICELSAENSAFRVLLDNAPVTELTRLVQLTDFFWAEFGAEAGKEQLVAALDKGTLAKLFAAPPVVDAILGWTGSPDVTLAWMDIAGENLPRVVELRLYESIDPLRISTLSLAALLAIDDNALIHKLRLLPTDQLLVLLQLPTEDLTQVTATATPDELIWLADYLPTLAVSAPLSGTENALVKQAVTVAHEVASGKVTIAELQAPPPVAEVASASSGGASGSSSSASGASESGASGDAQASTPAPPLSGIPKAVVELWTPWANNGVAVAAAVVVLILVALGVAMALRRQITHPPV